ncbi:MAG: OmpA family protein [bacterium]
MKKILQMVLLITVSAALFSCGINKEVHQKALNDLASAQKNHKDAETVNNALKKEIATLKEENEKIKKDLLEVINEKMALNREIADLKQRNVDVSNINEDLMLQLKEKGASIDDLEARKSEMDTQREKMLAERDQLLKEQESLKEELEQARKMKEAAEKRTAEFQQLMLKLKTMIDSGKLSVTIRKGRMIVSLSNDVLFPLGKTTMTDEGKAAIAELCETLKTLEDRSFLVVGHSDSAPIKTKRFPSNWELSSQRAIEVVHLMIENGVKPEMLSAAGQADFDPIAEGDTPEDNAKNRRVEIVLLPKIEELPGFPQ